MAIELANICEMTNSLPQPGGVLDQDPMYLHMLQCVWQARAERAERERDK